MRDDITLYGLYCFDPSILTDLDLPEGIDEDELRFHILDNAGMLFPYHQVLPQLGISIHHWFSQNKENFARIIAAVNKEYNPIENYDRTEDRTLKTTGTESSSAQKSDSHTENGSHADEEHTTGSGEEHATNSASANSTSSSGTDTETTNQRAADNSQSFLNTTKEIGEATSTGENTSTSSGSADTAKSDRTDVFGSGTNSLTSSGTGNETHSGSRAEDVIEKLRVHGNIGVTTNQQMVSAEIDLRRYNIYEDITNRFTDKFLYGVW